MRALGILFGIIIIVSVFLPWETYIGKDYMFLIRMSTFLGIDNRSFDLLFHLDFLPIALTLVFILSISLANKHITWRISALVCSLIIFVIGTYNILHYLFIGKEKDYIPGDGLWIFAIVCLFALVLSILLLTKKNLLDKKLFQKLFDAESEGNKPL